MVTEPPAEGAPAGPSKTSPAAPHPDSATARSGGAAPAANPAVATGGTQSRIECSPVQAAAPDQAPRPSGGGATAKAPPAADPSPDDDPGDFPSAPVVIMGQSNAAAPAARPTAAALRRPSGGDFTAGPGPFAPSRAERARAGSAKPQGAPAVTPVAPAERMESAPRRVEPAAEGSHPRYTIHLQYSARQEDLRRTVQRYGLAHAAWYGVRDAEGSHYSLILGEFETVAAAREAMRALPQGLYANRPWVNHYPTSVTVAAFNGVPTARVAAVGSDILR